MSAAAAIAATAQGALAPRRAYSVQSVVITFKGFARTAAAVDRSGRAGTMVDTLSGTFTGAAAPGSPVTLETPTRPGQPLCSPSCPAFLASGSVTVRESFTPSNEKPISCGATLKLPSGIRGRVYVTSSEASPGQIATTVRLTPTIDSLFRHALGARCTLPTYLPIDGTAGIRLPAALFPVSALGKRMKLSLQSTLGVPSHPSALSGDTVLRVTAIIAPEG